MYDHISSGDSKQDSAAVMSYFEASCMRLKKDFPHIKQIYVQSDNAKCYKTPELVFAMFEIAQQNGLELLCYIHTGVQDGKGPIDGHFATAMKQISKFCAAGNNIVTPVDIVNALRANGGVNNSIAEMVAINRTKIDAFLKKKCAIIKRLSFVKNHLEIRYDAFLNHVQGFRYSGVGSGICRSLRAEVDEEEKGEENEQELDDDEVISENEEDDDVVIDEPDSDEEDAQIGDMQVTGKGIVTGCLVYGGQLATTRIRTFRAPENIETEDEDELQCQICKKRFSHVTNLRLHVCMGAVGRRDLVHYGLSYAYERIDQHEIDIVIMSASVDENMGVFADIQTTGSSAVDFGAKWACSRGHGRMYGRKYIEAFKGDIVEMFNAGCRDKSFRMGAGRMLERIKRQNPGRLDLPSETEIRQAISALMAKMKSGKAITLSNSRGIAMPYLATVVRIFVEREGNVTPRDAWRIFQENHPPPEDLESSNDSNYPAMEKVKSKISALKTALKKNNVLPCIPE